MPEKELISLQRTEATKPTFTRATPMPDKEVMPKTCENCARPVGKICLVASKCVDGIIWKLKMPDKEVMPLITNPYPERLVPATIVYQDYQHEANIEFQVRIQVARKAYEDGIKAQRDADLKVLQAEIEWLENAWLNYLEAKEQECLDKARHEWKLAEAEWLESNNVIALIPGQENNLGLMITAEGWQEHKANLRKEAGE